MRFRKSAIGRQLTRVIVSSMLLFNLTNLHASPDDVRDSLDDWSRSMGESIRESGNRVKERLLKRNIRIEGIKPGESDLQSGTIYTPSRSQVRYYRPDGEAVL